MYCIIDVETTGGHPNQSKITEIAIFKFDGHQIVDQLVTLINPECHIPDFISQLTGITNEMVQNSPRFYEIAAKVVELTKDAIFVAHNVAFDYGCIRAEFTSLGYDFVRPQICSVRLSRALLPGHRSYSLGNLCADLGIRIDGRHRAGGDALATVQLFQILLKKNHGHISVENPYHQFDKKLYHPQFNWDELNNLPHSAGVYYLKDDAGSPLYIGHGNNVHRLVLDHLSRSKSLRSQKMLAMIASVDFVRTGTTLIATLLATCEVKTHAPRYNQVPKPSKKPYGLFHYIDQKGYHRFRIGKIVKNNSVLAGFQSMEEGTQAMYRWMDEYGLCPKLCGLQEGNSGCSQYHLNQCKGACLGIETPEEYNPRAEQLITELDLKHVQQVIIDKGREADEYSVVYIGSSSEIGWGYLSADEQIYDPADFKHCVKLMPDTEVLKPIIKNYFVSKHHPVKIVSLKDASVRS